MPWEGPLTSQNIFPKHKLNPYFPHLSPHCDSFSTLLTMTWKEVDTVGGFRTYFQPVPLLWPPQHTTERCM